MVAVAIHYACATYTFGLIAYVITSYIRAPRARSAHLWLATWYDPLLNPLRREIERLTKGGAKIDFSPMILLFLISIAKRILTAIFVPPP